MSKRVIGFSDDKEQSTHGGRDLDGLPDVLLVFKHVEHVELPISEVLEDLDGPQRGEKSLRNQASPDRREDSRAARTGRVHGATVKRDGPFR
jgi:hypothetical protein